jgi:hypothetical protein
LEARKCLNIPWNTSPSSEQELRSWVLTATYKLVDRTRRRRKWLTMTPKPVIRLSMVSDVHLEMGAVTEYTVVDGKTTMMVYLNTCHVRRDLHQEGPFSGLGRTNTTMHDVDSILRRNDQFRGSSGSSEGAGIKIISPSPEPEACFV